LHILEQAFTGGEDAPIRQSALALVPWVVLAAPFVIISKLLQPEVVTGFVTPLWARPLVAADALVFYLYKLVLPVRLGPDYGRLPQLLLRQWWIWHDSESLWRHAVAVSPEAGTAHYNLAFVLQKRGELEEAITHFRRALRLQPEFAEAHESMAMALSELGKKEEAIQSRRRCLYL